MNKLTRSGPGAFCKSQSCSKYYVIKYKYRRSTYQYKYNRIKLHNLEHFTKILGFTEMHRVQSNTQQLVLDST